MNQDHFQSDFMGILFTKKSHSPLLDSNQLNFIPDPPQHVTILPTIEQVEYPITMASYQKYKCDQCGMVFPSNEALFKHKMRFCIGVKDSGIGRQPVYSDDEELENQTRRSTVRHHSPVEKVRCYPSSSLSFIDSSDRNVKKSMIGNDNERFFKLSKIWKIESSPILIVHRNPPIKHLNQIIFIMKFFSK